MLICCQIFRISNPFIRDCLFLLWISVINSWALAGLYHGKNLGGMCAAQSGLSGETSVFDLYIVQMALLVGSEVSSEGWCPPFQKHHLAHRKSDHYLRQIMMRLLCFIDIFHQLSTWPWLSSHVALAVLSHLLLGECCGVGIVVSPISHIGNLRTESLSGA